MNKPKVSVCMITYNHAKYIAEAIQGVLMQVTDFEIEFIIANDASTDNTHSIIIQLAVDTSNITIKYINHPQNLGMIPNFVFALNQCKGKYIALCEGDDYWTDPLKLQKQVDFLDANEDYSLSFTRFKVKNEIDVTFSEDKNGHYFKEDLNIVFDFEKFVKGWYGGMPTLVFRTSHFDKAVLDEYEYFRDVHLFTELLTKGKGICLNDFTATYRIHEGGVHTSVSKLNGARIGSQCYKEIYERYKNIAPLKVKYRNFHQHFINELIHHHKPLPAIIETIKYAISMNDFIFFKNNTKKLIKTSLFYKVLKRFTKKQPRTTGFPGSENYWESRYKQNKNSGPGSYGRLAHFKAKTLNTFVENNDIKGIIEYGCGDGNQLSLSKYPSYIGFDVSETAVAICKQKFKGDPTKQFFLTNDTNRKTLKAELVLSLDVIFHLVEDKVFENYMYDLFNASTNYVIIYSSNYDEDIASHVKSRRFANWIEKNISEIWMLKEIINNEFPYNKDYPDDTSMSDFYIFQKKNP